MLHRARSPFRPFRGLMVAVHAPFVVDCVDRFVGQRRGRFLIHSFGAWSGVGIAAARRLRKRGIDFITVATPFSTYGHETRAKLQGLHAGYSPLVWLQHWLELAWVRLTVDPSQRRGLTESHLVLINYHSVRAIIEAEFGRDIRFGKMTYCSEAAFLREGKQRTAVPETIAGLGRLDGPLIVSVSRHDLRKGLDVFLRALAILRERGIPFRACLVGGGSLLEAHRRLAQRLGLTECTAVVGRVPDSYSYLEHADIFVLPSLEEGSGSVSLLEAMQAGAAAVVSRVDGLPEDVEEGENALLIEPANATALATALARLVVDEELRKRIAEAARQRYLERFSSEEFAADLQRIYQTFVKQRSSDSGKAN